MKDKSPSSLPIIVNKVFVIWYLEQSYSLSMKSDIDVDVIINDIIERPFRATIQSEWGLIVSTFDKVADIISDTSEIPREEITPESHTIDDLGIDSLDFLDIVFAVDKEFGIKIPLETWTQEVNDGKASTEEYFVMKNLVSKIDELIANKA